MTAEGTRERVEYRALDTIRPYPGNPRANDGAVDAVAASIREFGFRNPIIVDADGTIIAGHTRYKAARALGLSEVPVLVADDLTPEQVAAYRLADNKTGEMAEWDSELLAQELDGLADLDMSAFGFDDSDLHLPEFGEACGGMERTDVEEVEPDDSAPDRVRPGELWRMGDHVLLCGDATSPDDVKRLIEAGGVSADMLLTDPPYNVALGQHYRPSELKQIHRRQDGLCIDNDQWDDDEAFIEFLVKAFSSALDALSPGAAFYIWYASTQSANFLEAAKRAGMTIRQLLVWAKNTFALGRQDYQWRHEPCLYGWKDGAAHHWYADRKQTTVLEFDKPLRSEEHPTMKPVKLFAYLVRNSSRPGDLVLDPFAGSGTTVIACEQLKRRAAVMELDPHYASVIVERWERLTGKTAVRADG